MTQIIFDCKNSRGGWTDSPEFNIMFMRHAVSYLNCCIQAKKGVYGHEIYDVFEVEYDRLSDDEGMLTKLYTGEVEAQYISDENKCIVNLYTPEDLIEL